MEKVKLAYTPIADKIISAICLRFHRRKDCIYPKTTWRELGFSEEDKIAVFQYVEELCRLTIYEADYPDIPTVWDLLRYIEGHDSWDGIPGRRRENKGSGDRWMTVCVSPNCRFPRHVKIREASLNK